MTLQIVSAIQDFRRARRRAALQEIAARLSGRSVELLSYEEVRRQIRAQSEGDRGLREIPLEAIVGSVGRYADFNRSFLPLRDSDEDRWVRVKVATEDLAGLPPIEVYQIGAAYFVRDGNHRVSVARQMGTGHIQAYVTEVQSKVPLSPDVQPDELLVKAEYAAFIEATGIDELQPQADLGVTVPGQYEVLLEHIEVHRYFMGLEQQREIPYEEAVDHWYETVYAPIVEVIREKGVLWDFPQRTECDLYLWLAEHRAHLEEELGWPVRPEAAAKDLADRFSPQRAPARLGKTLLNLVLPESWEPTPPPGQWRQERLALLQRENCLFAHVLVAIDGQAGGWTALEQALSLARREGAQLKGIHVVPSDEAADGEFTQSLRERFARQCAQAGIPGSLAIEAGEPAAILSQRARWCDLVVAPLSHPPGSGPLSRLEAGFRGLLRRCPRPVLAVPEARTASRRALLAYDGSPQAEQALFVATYLTGQWDVELTVLTVLENRGVPPETQERARRYLEEFDLRAAYLLESGSSAQAILRIAEERDCDLLLLGGYSAGPVLQVVLGSSLDEVLRTSRRPVLVCR
ncbi:MAG: universal stress protein [Chloroflexia bacterium]|nr:universal stress protein [Chloroflexia bacterium]